MTQQSRDRWIGLCPYWVIMRQATILDAETEGVASFILCERRRDSQMPDEG